MTAREPLWKQDGLPPMVNSMLIVSAKSQSVRGVSHQSAFKGSSYLTISHTCLSCLLSRLVSPCVPGVIEGSEDAALV